MFQTNSLREHFNYCDIPVNFAGLIGTTRDMVRNGWELNLHADRSEIAPSIMLAISGKHRQLNLRLISARFNMDYHYLSSIGLGEVFRYLSNSPIRVSGCSENIVVAMYGNTPPSVVSSNWSGQFGFADPVSIKQHDFDSLFHFPSNDNTIVIREDKIWTIEEHLDAIRKAQEPMQDEILRGMDLTRKTSAKLQLIGIA